MRCLWVTYSVVRSPYLQTKWRWSIYLYFSTYSPAELGKIHFWGKSIKMDEKLFIFFSQFIKNHLGGGAGIPKLIQPWLNQIIWYNVCIVGSSHHPSYWYGSTPSPPALLPRPALEVSQPLRSSTFSSRDSCQEWTSR